MNDFPSSSAEDRTPVPELESLPDSSGRVLPVFTLICGILAFVLNALLIPVFLGMIFGITGFITGIISLAKYRKYGGLIFSLLSLIILFLWLISILVPLLNDPTISLTVWE